MQRILISLVWLSASAAFCQSEVATPLLSAEAEAVKTSAKSWKLSLIPLFAAQGLDARSSWGYVETNPMLAGPDGRFGMKAAGIKFGVVGAAAVAEYLLIRRHPKWAKLFARANNANAILTTGFAVHNFAVTR